MFDICSAQLSTMSQCVGSTVSQTRQRTVSQMGRGTVSHMGGATGAQGTACLLQLKPAPTCLRPSPGKPGYVESLGFIHAETMCYSLFISFVL